MAPSIREREHGLLECTASRRKRPDVGCDTVVGKVVNGRLIVRCRNCGTDHVFVVKGDRIVAQESRPPVRIAPARAVR